MKIVIASDAWHPQVNGVVRALSTTVDQLRVRGHRIELITPDQYRTIPCPSYPEIRLALGCGREIALRLDMSGADAVHIATEGPIGWAVRRWCLMRKVAFTTSFHTRFPDYVAKRTRLPADWIWPVMRRFHGPAARVLVATAALGNELAERGIANTHLWPLGVDLALFDPTTPPLAEMAELPRPIQLYVGRVAVEKNLGAFLGCDTPGSKVVVGDGPDRVGLAGRYPQARFLGAMHGPKLASAYTAADVFVFPSRTETFGLVSIEALACGTPVAAYPVAGPIDIIGARGTGRHGGRESIGAVDKDLAVAIRLALQGVPAACIAEASHYTWDRCTDAFEAGLGPCAAPEATPALAA